jgi:hypothetical protein
MSTKSRKSPDVVANRFDLFIERITGRVAKITGLVTAIGGLLVVGIHKSDDLLGQLAAHGLYAARPCVTIDTSAFPATVKLSDWNNTTVRLHGTKNCATDVGLYVTFLRDFHDDQLFVMRPPRGNFSECNAFRSDLYPNCWDWRKPLVKGKGEWTWNVPLPPLERLRDPRAVETIQVSWSVRDYDNPNKSPILADTAAILVSNDGSHQ